MYTFLFIHTIILTIVLFFIHFKTENIINEKLKELESTLYIWISIGVLLLFSIIVSVIAHILNITFLNFIFFIILLISNSLMFIVVGVKLKFECAISMVIMFDSASLVILIFLALIKDAPSSFWLICSCVAGNLLSMYILTRVFSGDKYLIFLTCLLSFAIYEIMNYKALDCKKSIPSMLSLPFNLNISIILVIYYIFYCIFYLFKSCCSSSGKKK